MDFRKYTGKHYLGAIGDFTAEWWTDKDWENHAKYVEELKEKGEYLKEVDVTIELLHNPILDESKVMDSVKPDSCKFFIFDVSNS